MNKLDYTTLQVGQQIAVARPLSWSVSSEGIYRVSKVNKMKVEVTRDSDGYMRQFSVKRQCEVGSTDRYRGAFLETVEDQKARHAEESERRNRVAAWSAVESAARGRDEQALELALVQLAKHVDIKVNL